jgi:hypothetical protein
MVRPVINGPSLLETIADCLKRCHRWFVSNPCHFFSEAGASRHPQFSARCRKAARSTCIANTVCRNIATASSETNFRDALSFCGALNCCDARCLTQCHLGFVSDSCHFFRRRVWNPECFRGGASNGGWNVAPLSHVTVATAASDGNNAVSGVAMARFDVDRCVGEHALDRRPYSRQIDRPSPRITTNAPQ